MSTARTYLDHNATTPVAPEVAAAMWPYLTEHFGNPSSATPAGARARAAVDHAREQVAALVDDVSRIRLDQTPTAPVGSAR